MPFSSLAPALTPSPPSGVRDQDFRKLVTTRGTYFVPWSPESVKRLLTQEKITPNELLVADKREVHYLIRDLFLLACKEEMMHGINSKRHISALALYAQNLRSTVKARHNTHLP